MRPKKLPVEVVASRQVPGLASLHLARLREDGRLLIEFVDAVEPGVPKSRAWVMLISTQIGCAVGCRFCDVGALGYQGNLTAEEILGQIRFIADKNRALDLSKHPKIKVHFSRMGEPSLNPNVLSALESIGRDLGAPNLIPCLSTVAPKSPVTAAFFDKLLKDAYFAGGRFELQFSVHATEEDGRAEIVPIKKWTLAEIAAYGRRFLKKGDRKMTLNFAPPPGGRLEAGEVARLFARERFRVKLTPVVPTQAAGRSKQTRLWSEAPAGISGFARELRERGFEVEVSPSLPAEVEAAAACGQLWSETLREQSLVLPRNLERQRLCRVTSENLAEKARSRLRAVSSGGKAALPLRLEKAALLVLDMRESFLSPRSPAFLPQARVILLNVRRLLDAFRLRGRPVFFTTRGEEISRILEPREGEVFRKNGHGPYPNPKLERALRLAGVERLILAGIVDEGSHDAAGKGFEACAIADAAAADSEESLLSALQGLARAGAGVRLTEDVVESGSGRPSIAG